MDKHTEAGYDLLDTCDRIAASGGVGPEWAYTLISGALAQAAAFFPKITEKAIGPDLVATYKAAGARLPGRAFKADAVPPAVASALTAAIAAVGEDAVKQALRDLVQPQVEIVEKKQAPRNLLVEAIQGKLGEPTDWRM